MIIKIINSPVSSNMASWKIPAHSMEVWYNGKFIKPNDGFASTPCLIVYTTWSPNTLVNHCPMFYADTKRCNTPMKWCATTWLRDPAVASKIFYHHILFWLELLAVIRSQSHSQNDEEKIQKGDDPQLNLCWLINPWTASIYPLEI